MAKSGFKRWLRRHIATYVAGLGLLYWLNAALAGSGWFFWVVVGWSVVLMFHYCLVKALSADESWVREHTQDIRYRSYDLDHIQDIIARHQAPLTHEQSKQSIDK